MSEKVIITGHSSGLGLALAACWLECEANVHGLSRRANHILQVAYPNLFSETMIDLADFSQLQSFLLGEEYQTFCQGAERLWLFNCAGVQSPAHELGDQEAKLIDKAVRLNVSAPFILSDALVKYAREQGRLPVNIVHISSGAAHKAYPGWSVYGATKAALDQHARCGAAEQQLNVKIVSLAPGVIDTPMQAEIRQNLYFPNRKRFLQLHESGELQSAEETAVKILSYCLSQNFGSQPVVDIRNLSSF